jgi:Zn finger protein HypA/HybF involved in hydrogenase expression
LSVKCPECDYVFSNKKDFSKIEIGATIQCPVCKTELKVTKSGQLEVLDLKSDL